jgi:hypothetical protein
MGRLAHERMTDADTLAVRLLLDHKATDWCRNAIGSACVPL